MRIFQVYISDVFGVPDTFTQRLHVFRPHILILNVQFFDVFLLVYEPHASGEDSTLLDFAVVVHERVLTVLAFNLRNLSEPVTGQVLVHRVHNSILPNEPLPLMVSCFQFLLVMLRRLNFIHRSFHFEKRRRFFLLSFLCFILLILYGLLQVVI